jgi:hypothetical protein
MLACRRYIVRLALACASPLLAAAPASAQSDDGYAEIFDGTLAGWTIENDGLFSVDGGVLEVAAPRGWLKSGREYADFDLRAEFRFVTDDADSGIFVRARGDGGTFGRGWPNGSYQIQLRNPAGDSPFPPVGGLFRHGSADGPTEFDPGVAASASRPTGQWQTLEISVVGDSLRATLNGIVVMRAAGIDNAPGFVGLQGETGVVEFRALEIRPR